MKIVKNANYGGFRLSDEGYLEYARLAGFPLSIYSYDHLNSRYDKVEQGKLFCPIYLKGDLGESCGAKEFNEFYKNNRFHCSDLERTDPILIQVVENLGEKASAPYASLVIVEIPDDIDWEISDKGGAETIREKHRSW